MPIIFAVFSVSFQGEPCSVMYMLTMTYILTSWCY